MIIVSNMKTEDFFLEKSGLDSLRKELEVENNFLIKLVDTIPAKMYFEHNIQEKITADRHSAMDQAAEDLKRQSCNHIELSSKGKHKRARLDPLNQKSVSQIHDEMNKKNKKKRRKGSANPSASLTRATNIEELQKRLQERISLFQAQRKSAKNNPAALKRLKTKVKKLKQKGNVLKAKELSRIEKQPIEKKQENKPTFNKDSNILYSKFDFSEDGQEDSAKKDEYSGKKVKTLLKRAEKKKEKIENLKDVDAEKAELISTKEKWKKAILKTEGVKVRDDPTLLKKSLKKEEKKKKKSAKVWKERNEEVDKKKKARQDKRNQNLMKKKKEKLDHKLKLARKKGRIIPGAK